MNYIIYLLALDLRLGYWFILSSPLSFAAAIASVKSSNHLFFSSWELEGGKKDATKFMHAQNNILTSDFQTVGVNQRLSQDLQTGCPNLATVKIFGYLYFFKEEHNIFN